jgi:KUP system potassium uptake protein
MWGWSGWLAGLVTIGFLIPDLSFLGANFIKIEAGGWFPLLVAMAFYLLMTTWKAGRRVLALRLLSGVTLEEFLNNITDRSPMRVPGTAVFMTQDPVGTPTTLLHNLKHNKVLHDRIVLLTILTKDVPHVPGDERLQVTDMGKGFYRVIGQYGFMEDPNVPELLQSAARPGLQFNRMETTYFLGRETLIPSKRPEMQLWRKRLFALMARNAHRATAFFRIPPNRVVELGAQVEL